MIYLGSKEKIKRLYPIEVATKLKEDAEESYGKEAFKSCILKDIKKIISLMEEKVTDLGMNSSVVSEGFLPICRTRRAL